jgi:TolA-binding protein
MSTPPDPTAPVEPIEPELRRLLDEAKHRDAKNRAFDDAAAERALVRIERTLDEVPAPRRGLSLRSGVFLVSACILATLAGTKLVERSDTPPAPARVASETQSSPTAVATTPDTAIPSQATEDSNPGSIPMLHVNDLPSSAQRPSPPPAPSASTLEEEYRLVDGARAKLASKDYAGALRSIREHAERFPSGQLNQECESLHIQALVETGRLVEARQRADAFRLRFPKGLLLPSVARAIASSEPASATP